MCPIYPLFRKRCGFPQRNTWYSIFFLCKITPGPTVHFSTQFRLTISAMCVINTRERSTARGPVKSIWKGQVAACLEHIESNKIIKTYLVYKSDTTKERLVSCTNATILNGAWFHSTLVSLKVGMRTAAVFGTCYARDLVTDSTTHGTDESRRLPKW